MSPGCGSVLHKPQVTEAPQGPCEMRAIMITTGPLPPVLISCQCTVPPSPFQVLVISGSHYCQKQPFTGPLLPSPPPSSNKVLSQQPCSDLSSSGRPCPQQDIGLPAWHVELSSGPSWCHLQPPRMLTLPNSVLCSPHMEGQGCALGAPPPPLPGK